MALTEDEEFELLSLERERSIRGAAPEQPGLLRRGFNALNQPSELSREGLGQLSGLVPQPEPRGDIVGDIVRGAPRIAAETVAEVAPQFIDAPAILTAGGFSAARAAVPAIKATGGLIGKGLESLSGLEHQTPGVLAAAAKDSSLLFSKGKKAAAALYEEAKAGKDFNIFKGLFEPKEIVDTAKAYISKGGVLEPTEALMYRKAVDKLLKSGKVVKDELIAMRQEADAIAKQSDLIAQADPLFVRGMRAEALRQFLPQNKYGGASAFKAAIATYLKGLGLVTLPIVQGAAATGAGVGARLTSKIIGGSAVEGSNIGAILQSAAKNLRTPAGRGALTSASLGFGQKREKRQ